MINDYEIESSTDGKKWRLEGAFNAGEPSRFGPPMNDELAAKEARSFADYRKDYVRNRYVRLVVNIKKPNR